MLDSNKWAYTKSTVIAFSEAYESVIKFGVRTFPDAVCKASKSTVIALKNSATLKSKLTTPSASAQTPIADALKNIAPQFGDPNEGQYVLLITDGSETCDSKQTSAVLEAVTALRSKSISTIAIGIGTTANMTMLNEVAQKGGTGKAFLATDATKLTAVLKGIFSTIIDCSDTCFGKSCGGKCGKCTKYSKSFCGPFGMCRCTPDCSGKKCGDDGCGGTCTPGCPSGQGCESGTCKRFIDNGDGTISDWKNKLMWQKVSNAAQTWAKAKSHCSGLTYAGYSNWKMPHGNCKCGVPGYGGCQAIKECDSSDGKGEWVTMVDNTANGCASGTAPCVPSQFKLQYLAHHTADQRIGISNVTWAFLSNKSKGVPGVAGFKWGTYSKLPFICVRSF